MFMGIRNSTQEENEIALQWPWIKYAVLLYPKPLQESTEKRKIRPQPGTIVIFKVLKLYTYAEGVNSSTPNKFLLKSVEWGFSPNR